ncbi:hypothetical protein SAMN04487866_105124 [Thermoactinomyces sp. DSM 45891]|uniref:hypothetical protein n=1 Tax=Thermoactinomyces sp. DSM 45891 TaxID=1761907 RepID=UPI000911DC26|nr:hypothetical protein [Thermoactinomyces sp. DSM 45891]SFX35824.1 hypothetical protein SAMN04487866_105124 [Thermoactinomyces sp. DSM 45891]
MKKLIATGLALSMLMGGAVLSSSNAHASTLSKDHEVITVSNKSQSIEPQRAGLVRAAATGVGMGLAWAAGKAAGLFGSSGLDTSSNYEYDSVQEAFDQ